MAAVQVPGAGRTTTPLAAGLKVRAIQTGYYDHIKRVPGDVFFIDSATYDKDVKGTKTGDVIHTKGDVMAFSSVWMERVSADTPEKVTSAPQALREKQDELKAGKSTGDKSVI